nr:site-specific integrase [uncultured Flavonifractor sp.]
MEFKHGIRPRGDKFQFTVSNGFDGNGKQIRKYMTYRPPDGLSGRQLKRVVEAAYDNFYVKVTSNQSLKENMRFFELGDLYFSQYASNCLKEITAYTYKGSYRKNIKPVFGNTRLKDLTTARITEFLLELGKTKKPQTVRKNKIILHSILEYAVSQKFITENPCIGTIWKRDVEIDSSERNNYLSAADAKRLMELVAPYSTFNTIIKLLLLTGLRSGEALGLTWDKIDFENKTIFIDKTLTYVTGRYFLSTPKTPMSIRKIIIDDATVQMLQEHKAEQDKQKRIIGSAWLEPEAVFTSATGHFYDRSLLNTQFRRFMGRHSELHRVTIHGLRHTHASLLILAGENLDAISKHLGHASADITSRVYAHLMSEVQVRITQTISGVLR